MSLNPEASSYYPRNFPLLHYSSQSSLFPPSPVPPLLYHNINLQPQTAIYYCSPPHLDPYRFPPCGTISYHTLTKQLAEPQVFPRLPPPPQFALELEEVVGDENGKTEVPEVRQQAGKKKGSGEKYKKSKTTFFQRAFEKTKSTTQRNHSVEFEEGSSMTTVMMRNLPNKFTRVKLMEILDAHCMRENEKIRFEENGNLPLSEYDFIYLPIDFRTGSNKGYAFVNFTSPVATQRFCVEFKMKSWKEYGSGKNCDITPACYQGLSALKDHFKNSAFCCDSDDYLPVWFTPSRNGLRQPEEHYACSRFPFPKKMAGRNLHLSRFL